MIRVGSFEDARQHFTAMLADASKFSNHDPAGPTGPEKDAFCMLQECDERITGVSHTTAMVVIWIHIP